MAIKELKKFANSMGINKVVWEHDVVTYCPLGNDYCPHKVMVEITDPENHLDYLSIKEYCEKTLNGVKFSTEDLCAAMYDFCIEHYEPTHLKVVVSYNGYFNVTLTKEF